MTTTVPVRVLWASAALQAPRLPLEASEVVVSPVSQEAAVLPASEAPLMLRLALGSELVEPEASALPEVSAPARQASRYSDSLFLQPLVSFFILIFFGWQESSRTATKTRNSNT